MQMKALTAEEICSFAGVDSLAPSAFISVLQMCIIFWSQSAKYQL